MNRQNLPYKLKVNHMTDYSDSEIKRMRGYRHTTDSPRGELFVSAIKHSDIPTYYNWRLRGKCSILFMANKIHSCTSKNTRCCNSCERSSYLWQLLELWYCWNNRRLLFFESKLMFQITLSTNNCVLLCNGSISHTYGHALGGMLYPAVTE